MIYTVGYTQSEWFSVPVEADSPEEAERLAADMDWNAYSQGVSVECDFIREGCGHRTNVVTCGICDRSWCESCDPAPSALCHYCHGRGHSTAPVEVTA
jgi:hypothetical protein